MSDDSEMDGHDLAERRAEEADHPATGRSEAHKDGLMNSNIDYRSHGVPLETYELTRRQPRWRNISAQLPRTRHETIPHPRRSPTVPGGFSVTSPHFRPRRHRLTADDYRTEMADRFATWNDITRSSEAT